MNKDSDVLNTLEAAKFLGAHPQTVRKLARSGTLPSFKLGKDWRFRKASLLDWVEQQHFGNTRCSVLIVDDEERVRNALARMVEQLGCRARQAKNGVVGLELVRDEAPDLVLIDLMMPDMNGPQFMEELRIDHPRLPVIIVTGYPDSELMRQASQHAPVMLLSKPVERNLLESTLHTLMGEKLANAGSG
jgi:excisionase family DNA binding protein